MTDKQSCMYANHWTWMKPLSRLLTHLREWQAGVTKIWKPELTGTNQLTLLKWKKLRYDNLLPSFDIFSWILLPGPSLEITETLRQRGFWVQPPSKWNRSQTFPVKSGNEISKALGKKFSCLVPSSSGRHIFSTSRRRCLILFCTKNWVIVNSEAHNLTYFKGLSKEVFRKTEHEML